MSMTRRVAAGASVSIACANSRALEIEVPPRSTTLSISATPAPKASVSSPPLRIVQGATTCTVDRVGPFEHADGDPAYRPRLDGVQHLKLLKRLAKSHHLLAELALINAVRTVNGKHQRQSPLLRRLLARCPIRTRAMKQQNQRPPTARTCVLQVTVASTARISDNREPGSPQPPSQPKQSALAPRQCRQRYWAA